MPTALSASTSPTPNHPRTFSWYRRLEKPPYKPPDVAIPIAWTRIEGALRSPDIGCCAGRHRPRN
ncbi:MAG: TspO/MBR family protein [Pyrinomonadaceae bacterium]